MYNMVQLRTPVCNLAHVAGEAKGFKSLLGKAESSVWYQTAAQLASLIPPKPAPAPPAEEAAPGGKKKDKKGKKGAKGDDGSDAAAAAAAAAPPAAPEAPQFDNDAYERKRAAAEALMEAEAAAFEKELSKRNPSDARWLQQVRRAGTGSDKMAAASLLVQVRGASEEDRSTDFSGFADWQACGGWRGICAHTPRRRASRGIEPLGFRSAAIEHWPHDSGGSLPEPSA